MLDSEASVTSLWARLVMQGKQSSSGLLRIGVRHEHESAPRILLLFRNSHICCSILSEYAGERLVINANTRSAVSYK